MATMWLVSRPADQLKRSATRPYQLNSDDTILHMGISLQFHQLYFQKALNIMCNEIYSFKIVFWNVLFETIVGEIIVRSQ